MARKRESLDGENVQKKQWKLLLYPDNPVHVQVMDNIERLYPETFIYCQHRNYDIDGSVITVGAGKLHVHYGLLIDKEEKRSVRRGSLAKQLGLVDESGLPDFQFLQPVYGDFDDFLPYLTHRNSPDKEQYPDSELVCSPWMFNRYRRGAIESESKSFHVRECLQACLDWIWSHDGRVTYTEFARWVIQTPFFRCRNDRLLISCLEEHNHKIAMRELEMISGSAPAYQEQLEMVSGGREIWLGDKLYHEDDFIEV